MFVGDLSHMYLYLWGNQMIELLITLDMQVSQRSAWLTYTLYAQ